MSELVVVLVHGAFHGGWCFDPVVKELESAGIRTIAVDLPSVGDGGGPRADLHGDAAHVREVLDSVDAPVLLVGHSYGGAVITEAGVHPNVRHLVYLCALIPGEEETPAQLLGAPDRPDVGNDPVPPPSAEQAASRFFHDCDEADVTWAVAKLQPQSFAWMGQRPLAAAWRERPSTYAVCSNDRVVSVDLQRAWASRCTTSIEWDSSHSPFLSHPAWVSGLLTATLGSLATREPGQTG
jgi:pimeloyl-ACP methyl ester carboxylesterase